MDKEVIREVIKEELEAQAPSKKKKWGMYFAKSILPIILAVFTLSGVFGQILSKAKIEFESSIRGVVKEELAPINGWILTEFVFDISTQLEKVEKRPFDINESDLNRLIGIYSELFPEDFKTIPLTIKVDRLKEIRKDLKSGKFKQRKGAG